MAERSSTVDETARRMARAAGLRHVSDREPGFRRQRKGRKFSYFYPDGRKVRDEAVIRRIQAAAVPPAYTDVWICGRSDGHIQATARDARGRKQYRYHRAWEEIRAAAKYRRMLAFGAALPMVRRRVAACLRLKGMPRQKVLATVVRLLEATLIRVGNDEYARKNRSYGLTTLCNHHVDVTGSTIRFDFRGKSGVPHCITISHPTLAGIVTDCLEMPGRELFQYFDESGERRAVGSADVNAFLQEVAGADFTAKDYRTWAGSVCALAELRKRSYDSIREMRGHIVDTVKAVTARLGNSPAICRKSYIHPGLFDAYAAGSLPGIAATRYRGLSGDEAVFMRFLRQGGRARPAPSRANRRTRNGT